MKQNFLKLNPTAVLIAVLPFALGGFFTWTSCLVSIVLCVLLFVRFSRQGSIILSCSLSSFAVLLLPLCYLLAVFLAQDRGMALPGFCRALPALLWAVQLWQQAPESREAALEVLPWSGAVMTFVSVPLSYLPALEGHLLVNGRQAGFFEYPNTYALFLLLGLIVLATREKHRWYHGLLAAVLLAGIFLSGSRTVFILLGIAAVLLAVFTRRKLVRFGIIIAVSVSVAAAVIYTAASGNVSSIGRFLTTSLHSSTFLGRLLYARDALPVILKHPLGLGFGAYAAMQGSFQTGVYSVQSVHNDLLQLMLEAGWLPAIALAAAILIALLRKGNTLRRRLLLGVICVHGLFDFSLQFLSILFVLVLLLDFGNYRQVKLQNSKKGCAAVLLGLFTALNLYFGTVTGFAYLGKDTLALKLDGSYTESLTALLAEETDITAADAYAEKILELNAWSAPAYRTRAMNAYSQGDIESMILYQRKAIACAPYDQTVYTDYLQMLSVAASLYENSGDTESAEFCREEMQSVPDMMEETLEKTSSLGWQIDTQPDLTLPEEYAALLEE